MDKKSIPPLLVKIQSINTQTLDFNGVKTRNITCVEASNFFLFIGCASGTTYVFSRESLKFLFVIGFKGGKVCYISCAPDESDVSIASVRGKVSLYRLSPNLRITLTSSPGESFRHLYDVPHHVGSEITEMKWSPNGKYFFIGDSQGIVSQVDVGSLEEFPRPPPSQIILKINSRVLQMDCIFPYFAVCSLSGVFLCDLEKEDFTRIKTKGNKDLKATGVCLQLQHQNQQQLNSAMDENGQVLPNLCLFIGEQGRGVIHRCNMQGKIIKTEKVKETGIQAIEPVKIFDPKDTTEITYPTIDVSKAIPNENNFTFALGKLFNGDNQNNLITLLNDRLFIIDPKTLQVVIWSEDFQRINSLSMISNYMFIWHGNKVDVLSFTEFRPYALQLLNNELNNVLEKWMRHTIISVGWKMLVDHKEPEDTQTTDEPSESTSLINKTTLEERNKISVGIFEFLLGESYSQDPLCSFFIPLLPFELPNIKNIELENSSDLSETVDLVEVAIQNFTEKIENMLKLFKEKQENEESLICFPFEDSWKMIQIFYVELEAEVPNWEKKDVETDTTTDIKPAVTLISEFSVPKVFLKSQTFLKQPQLVNLAEILESRSKKTWTLLKDFVETFLTHLSTYCATFSETTEKVSTENNPNVNSMCFIDYCKSLYDSKWFSDIGVDKNAISYDILLADALLLVTPLLKQEHLTDIIKSIRVLSSIENYFCTWIVITNFINDDNLIPYASILRTLQSESLKVHPKEIFPHIYQDLLVKDISKPAKYLYHFVTALVFNGKKWKVINRRIVLSTLLSTLPFKHWPKKETIDKIVTLCTENIYLVKIFQMACLEGKNLTSIDLCDCGLPGCCSNLGVNIILPQKIIEEGVLAAMMKASSGKNLNFKDNLMENEIHTFAMKRSLFEAYLKSACGNQLKNSVKIDIVLRTGSQLLLSLLHYLQDSEETRVLMEKMQDYKALGESIACRDCGRALKVSSDFQPLNEEIIGMWIYTGTGSIDKLIELLHSANLNHPRTFSLRFYQQIINSS